MPCAPSGKFVRRVVLVGLAGFALLAVPQAFAVPADCSVLPDRPPVVATALGTCVACHRKAQLGPRTLEEMDRGLCERSTSLVERMMLLGSAADGTEPSESQMDVIRERQRILHSGKPPEFDFQTPRIKLSTDVGLELLPIGDRTDAGGYFFEYLKAQGPVVYDAKSLPKVRQSQPSSARMSIEDFFKVVFPRADTRTGNTYADRGGLEFPWEKGAATDLAPLVQTFRFFVPPRTGPMLETFRVDRKHRLMYSDFVNEDDMLHGYTFLPGTAFLEVLAVKNPANGAFLPIEVRVRAVDARGAWYFDILRPFPTRSALATELHVRFPVSGRPVAIEGLLRETETPSITSLRAVALTDVLPSFWQVRNSQATQVLEPQAAVHRLPKLSPEAWVDILQNAPFRSAMGLSWLETSWKDSSALIGYAPESDEAVHFAPKGYFGSHLKTASSQCAKCHSDTQYAVRRFDPPRGSLVTAGSSSVREWYAHMQGSTPQLSRYGLPPTGIFSFHPFAQESVIYDIGSGKPVRFDARLAGAGLLRVTDEVR